MDKWADYLISAVHYEESSPTKKHIGSLKVHKDLGDGVGDPGFWTRTNVIERVKLGFKFMTIFKSDDNQWQKGAEVKIDPVQGKLYLKTKPNGIPEDNLENLPEF